MEEAEPPQRSLSALSEGTAIRNKVGTSLDSVTSSARSSASPPGASDEPLRRNEAIQNEAKVAASGDGEPGVGVPDAPRPLGAARDAGEARRSAEAVDCVCFKPKAAHKPAPKPAPYASFWDEGFYTSSAAMPRSSSAKTRERLWVMVPGGGLTTESGDSRLVRIDAMQFNGYVVFKAATLPEVEGELGISGLPATAEVGGRWKALGENEKARWHAAAVESALATRIERKLARRSTAHATHASQPSR
eukprot:CAMPEP_0172624132 /NCGR_PEP_ID=MMETSP1068-20121228/134065_1 /TAXON_ID=35684 /ORGANISM="Pseudopedinella elastica, Strain CCMP716" /LENGTH=246 /DNA_ID=CAMNT_0013432953 /DNA_START=28 /DNA_END=768 /DNA_ORIENTATION=-